MRTKVPLLPGVQTDSSEEPDDQESVDFSDDESYQPLNLHVDDERVYEPDLDEVIGKALDDLEHEDDV